MSADRNTNELSKVGQGPNLVEMVPSKQIGVDFLNLRTINFALMDDYLPGISNTTRYLRVYTFITWAWWKAYQCISRSQSLKVQDEQVRAFVDRMETLFTWGHLRKDEIQGLPGYESIPKGEGPTDLTFESLRRSRENTSLMAAVQYGPSLKAANGLGFLIPVEGNRLLFRVAETALPAVHALDEGLRQIVDYQNFESLQPFQGTAAMADSLLPAWSIWHPSPTEKAIFRERFFPASPDTDQARKRGATIRLLRIILARSGGTHSDEIRRSCTSGLLPGLEPLILNREEEEARLKVAATQIRAAQRLAQEALFSWTEWAIQSARAKSLAEVRIIWLETWREFRELGLTSVHLARWGYGSKQPEQTIRGVRELEGHNIFTAMDRLLLARRDEQWQDVPNLAFELILHSAVLINAYLHVSGAVRIFRMGTGNGRWAMPEFSDFVISHADQPIELTFAAVLESCVFSQHLATAVFRDVRDRSPRVGRARRLRIAQGEFGLEALAARPSALNLTPDRIEAALSLMKDCDLCEALTQNQQTFPRIYRA